MNEEREADILEGMRNDPNFYEHAAFVARFIGEMLEKDYLMPETIEAIAHVYAFAQTMELFMDVAKVTSDPGQV